MIRSALIGVALTVAVLGIGCPPHGPPQAVGDKRPRAPFAPADYRVVNCQLEPDPPAGTATRKECYHDSAYRSPSPLGTCPEGETLEHGLCYRSCPAGYTGDGPVCWKDCPAGFHDDGVTCRKDLSIVRSDRHGCPWYDVCGVTFARGCTTCPEGYRNDGCTCVRDARIIGQDAQGRGAGTIPGCSHDQEKIGLLCYGACPQGFTANGFMCVANGETCVDVPVQQQTPLRTFCVELESPGYCGVLELQADKAETAEQLAACKCSNCSRQIIDCGYSDTVCR